MKLMDFVPPILAGAIGRRSQQARLGRELSREIHEAKMLAARALIGQNRARGPLNRLADAEFKVFSQFGDDGIIQYLVHMLDVQPQTFVEFGVEDYSEANTRFLLVNDNWRGLILDGSEPQMAAVRRESLYWRQDLTAIAAFIDRENINDLLAAGGAAGDLGLLSIDIDGNDYWVWDAIHVCRPIIVIAEFNSVFGAQRAVSIPYDPAFVRTRAHWSNLYWGCSLAALCSLAERKGFAFVGCNSNGNNAYFVDRDHLAPLRALQPEEGYVESRFRESRDQQGNLTYLSGAARRQAIAAMPLVDVETGAELSVGDL